MNATDCHDGNKLTAVRCGGAGMLVRLCAQAGCRPERPRVRFATGALMNLSHSAPSRALMLGAADTPRAVRAGALASLPTAPLTAAPTLVAATRAAAGADGATGNRATANGSAAAARALPRAPSATPPPAAAAAR